MIQSIIIPYSHHNFFVMTSTTKKHGLNGIRLLYHISVRYIRLLVILLITATLALTVVKSCTIKKEDETLWMKYCTKYSIDISDLDMKERSSIFLDNIRKIKQLNLLNNGIFYKMNHFGHLTEAEFMAFINLNYKVYRIKKINKTASSKTSEFQDIDWRKKGINDQVYDAGPCSSSYAFSAISQVESQYAIITNKTIKLSEQDIIDCSRGYDNNGCLGGWLNSSFEYMRNFGVYKREDLPYIADEGPCKHIEKTSVFKVSEFVEIEPGNDYELSKTISVFGPVSATIHVSGEYQFYSSGIYDSPNCNSTEMNHAVLIVGIGSGQKDHYILKNSWGKDWGIDGYMLLARGENICGIATAASYAKIVP